MRIAWLECFAGVAGDMFVAAALDAGVPFAEIEQAVAALDMGVTLQRETVDRSGISSTRFRVMVDGAPAEAAERARGEDAHAHGDEHLHDHEHPHTHEDGHKHEEKNQHAHSHAHEHSHERSHEHGHAHGRSLKQIRKLIAEAPLAHGIRQRATQIFELLGAVEAKIHNVPVESIHFHEVGSVDAIVDIVAASAAIEFLERAGPLQWHVSAINVGGGMVRCAHGTFPVPAPATAELLRGLPTYSAHLEKELATPTGAAILRALRPETGAPAATAFSAIGYGAGMRNPAGFPNVLRLSIGEQATEPECSGDEVAVLEAALDDAHPQVVAQAAQMLLAAGALDAMLTAVQMKKGRPGTLLTVLARPEDAARMEALIFRETTTLGLRVRREERRTLERRHERVETAFGPMRIKLGLLQGRVVNAAPEFEDCRAAAATHHAPLKVVMQAAIAAWQQAQDARGHEGEAR